MDFAYTALNPQGAKITDRLTSADADDALRQLHSQGLTVIALEAAGKQAAEKRGRAVPAAARDEGKTPRKGWGKGRVKLEQTAMLTREFAIMIQTGIPIVEALDLLEQHADSPTIGAALAQTRADLSGGKTLAQAMGAHPHVFPKFYVDMMRMAEAGGRLDATLTQAADYLDSAMEMRRKVVGAVTYPAVVLVVGVVVMLFTMTYLMPKFSGLFTQMHTEIPASTKFLLASSAFVRHFWWALPAIFGGLFVGARALLQLPSARGIVMRAVHGIPVVGALVKKIAIARILRALGALTETGVALLLALETAGQTSQNIVYEEAIARIGQRVEQGVSLSDAATQTGVFPGIVCQMLAVGERSGRLSEVLGRVATFYESEVDARLKMLSTIIEPLMIVVLGLMVGFIAISIIEPIYSLVNSVK